MSAEATNRGDRIEILREVFMRRLRLTCALCDEIVLDRTMSDKAWGRSSGGYHWTVKVLVAHVKEQHPKLWTQPVESLSRSDMQARAHAFLADRVARGNPVERVVIERKD